MVNYDLIDHTGDFGIIVTGKDLSALFANAAWAMFDVIARPRNDKDLGPPHDYTLRMVADDTEELLVNWLGELVSISDWKDLIFRKFDFIDLTATHIQARALGYERARFDVLREIKAVTYHNLKIEQAGGLYKASIIFDV